MGNPPSCVTFEITFACGVGRWLGAGEGGCAVASQILVLFDNRSEPAPTGFIRSLLPLFYDGCPFF
jgi:hypothetical protein